MNLIQVQKEGRWPVLLAFGQTDRAVAEEAAAVLQEEFEAMGFAAEVIGIQERDCNLVVVVEGGHLEGTMRLIETYIVLWYEEPQEEALVAG